MQDKISDLPVFVDTIYSPELFSDPNKTVESDDTTSCDNISDTQSLEMTMMSSFHGS
jgi:hypothetical protein